MIDILNLKNGMEDNLLLIQQINLTIQKEGEEQKGFDNVVIQAAQQHIDSINTVYTLGVSWLKEETDFALRFIQGILSLSFLSYFIFFFEKPDFLLVFTRINYFY